MLRKGGKQMAEGKQSRIRLKAYDHNVLDQSAEKLLRQLKEVVRKYLAGTTADEKEIITILRAVHKYKDAREQFEMRTHKRLIDILKPTPNRGFINETGFTSRVILKLNYKL